MSIAALDAALAARAADRAAHRAQLRAAGLELVRARGELCPSDMAAELGWSCSTARSVLRCLENAGLLTSETRAASHRPGRHFSPHGRRYFFLPIAGCQKTVDNGG